MFKWFCKLLFGTAVLWAGVNFWMFTKIIRSDAAPDEVNRLGESLQSVALASLNDGLVMAVGAVLIVLGYRAAFQEDLL